MFAGLVMEAGDWGWPLLAAFVVAMILSWLSYRRSDLTGPVRYGGITLRALGATILIVCLLEPLWTAQRARPGANWFAVVADNSQGMQIHDPGERESRGEQLRALLTDTAENWQDELGANFQLRRYIFDSRLQSVRDFQSLDFNGNASAIVTSLRAVQERFQGLPLAGVLVFTDGNATDYLEGLTDFADLPPIFPVVSGTDQPVMDLAITRVVTSQTAFEDAPVTVTAEVTANGFRGRPVEAVLSRV
ncbi:MAG TPA: hypothetical protein DCY13_23845, partial [Verrucomicrobiales bacterium]|nr:hypothetical protein [Verrucomicrobiales bacterium]